MMSRASWQILRNFNSDPNWDNIPISIQGFSGSEGQQIKIGIPTMILGFNVFKNPIVATFTVGNTMAGPTQTALMEATLSKNTKLKKCIIKNEVWLVGSKVIFLNNVPVFIVVPKDNWCFISPMLLSVCSPIAKTLKEKVIPDLIRDYNFKVLVTPMYDWIVRHKLHSSKNSPEQIILKHL